MKLYCRKFLKDIGIQGSMNRKIIFFVFLSNILIACGGGDSSSSETSSSSSLTAAEMSLSFTQVKGFIFSWSDTINATHYKLLENPDGSSGYNQVGGNIRIAQESITISVPLYDRLNARYILQTCNELNCVDSDVINVSGNLAKSVGYLKVKHPEDNDLFGSSVSLSNDGSKLAIGAIYEDSSAKGLNGDEYDDSASNSGAVYIFIKDGHTWTQEAYIKSSNAEVEDRFGQRVSLSGDGNFLAVGAGREDSNAKGIDGNQNDNTASISGAVYLFEFEKNSWLQKKYFKASNSDAHDQFGSYGLSLDYHGNTLAVSSVGEDSNSRGVNGNESDNSSSMSGAVYIFTQTDGLWTQEAYIKASNAEANDVFGFSLDLSNDGNTLAVGAIYENSSALGVNGDTSDNSAGLAGAAYLFNRVDGIWSEKAYFKTHRKNVTDGTDLFGYSISISGDGNTLAVGANEEDSSVTGVNSLEFGGYLSSAGAAYVFKYNNGFWVQDAYIKASDTGRINYFGASIDLNEDGNKLVVGAYLGDGGGKGINHFPSVGLNASGNVYVFERTSDTWYQKAYVKASNTDADDHFGRSLSLSANGMTLAVGATGESSIVRGNQSSNSADNSGAVYLY